MESSLNTMDFEILAVNQHKHCFIIQNDVIKDTLSEVTKLGVASLLEITHNIKHIFFYRCLIIQVFSEPFQIVDIFIIPSPEGR